VKVAEQAAQALGKAASAAQTAFAAVRLKHSSTGSKQKATLLTQLNAQQLTWNYSHPGTVEGGGDQGWKHLQPFATALTFLLETDLPLLVAGDKEGCQHS